MGINRKEAEMAKNTKNIDIDMNMFILGCLERTWLRVKNFIEFIGEYDLYNGRKWDDY